MASIFSMASTNQSTIATTRLRTLLQLVIIFVILLAGRRQPHPDLRNRLPIDKRLNFIGIKTQQARDLDTLMRRVRIPPSHVAVLLPIDDGTVIAGLAFVGTPGLGLAGLEVLPLDRRAGQVPAAGEVGLPERLDAAVVSCVGKHNAVDLDAHFAARRQDVDPVERVFRVVQHLRLLLVPRVQVLEFDLDETRQLRVERVGHE